MLDIFVSDASDVIKRAADIVLSLLNAGEEIVARRSTSWRSSVNVLHSISSEESFLVIRLQRISAS